VGVVILMISAGQQHLPSGYIGGNGDIYDICRYSHQYNLKVSVIDLQISYISPFPQIQPEGKCY
jgi:hypothetical protein